MTQRTFQNGRSDACIWCCTPCHNPTSFRLGLQASGTCDIRSLGGKIPYTYTHRTSDGSINSVVGALLSSSHGRARHASSWITFCRVVNAMHPSIKMSSGYRTGIAKNIVMATYRTISSTVCRQALHIVPLIADLLATLAPVKWN